MLVINDTYNKSNGMNFTVSEHPDPNTDQWVINGVYSMYDKAIIQDIDVSTFNVIPADTSTFVDTIIIDIENMQPLTKGSTRVSLPFELHAAYEDYEFFKIKNASKGLLSKVILHPDSSYNMYYYYGSDDYDPLVAEFNLLTEDTEINIIKGNTLSMYGDATSFRNKRPVEFVNAYGLYFDGNLNFLFQNLEITQDYACEGMFKNQTDPQIKIFPDRPIIPDSSILTVGCFKEMYMNCDVRVVGVGRNILKAEYVPSYAYQSMFENCTKFTNTSSTSSRSSMCNFMKSATSCGDYSFYKMFKGCTSLKLGAAPGVTTWGENPYNSMFEGCTSLTQVCCYFVGTREKILELFQNSDWLKGIDTQGFLYLSRELLNVAYPGIYEDRAKERAKRDFAIPSNWSVGFIDLP
jgi:hypothetical protein